MSHSQINALITLIEDPDPEIFSHIRTELTKKGETIIPHLERYWELNAYGDLFQDRVEQLIHTIQYEAIEGHLSTWKEDECNDLLDGALLVNRYQYPTCDVADLRDQINRIRQDIWLELNDSLTALEKVKVFNHIIYEVHGFEGNKQNYSSPQNSYLQDVLTSKKGNPLSLAVIYRILAESLDVPIFGVNLPNHFILAYVDESAIMNLGDGSVPSDNGILFYINPFSKGEVIHKTEIDEFLDYLDLPKRVSFYHPCDNKAILQRMLNNLVYSYSQMGKEVKVEELRSLLGLFAIPQEGSSATNDPNGGTQQDL